MSRKNVAKRTEVEKIFVANLFAFKFNLAQAMVASGYSPTGASGEGLKFLRRPTVQAMIADELERIQNLKRVTVEDIVAEAKHMAFSNLMDFTRDNGDGSRVIDFSDTTREQMAAVKEITVETYVEGRGENAKEVKKTKIALHDKLASMTLLLRYLLAKNGGNDPGSPNYFPPDNSPGTVVNNYNLTAINLPAGAAQITPQDATSEYQKLISLTPAEFRRAHGSEE